MDDKRTVPLTNEQYVEEEGLYCPFCPEKHADIVYVGSLQQIDAMVLVRDAECQRNPDHNWYERYVLKGYERY